MNLLQKTRTNGDFGRLRDEMDRMLQRFATDPWEVVEPRMLRTEGWLPPLDVSETENEVTVRAEMPGIPAKDLEISLSGTTLTISGHKQEQEEKKGENYYQCERRFGSFRRVVELPETIDGDKVLAESDSGVVTLRIPKRPSARPKQIEIKPVAKKVPVTG